VEPTAAFVELANQAEQTVLGSLKMGRKLGDFISNPFQQKEFRVGPRGQRRLKR
jgi:hypothetical protein